VFVVAFIAVLWLGVIEVIGRGGRAAPALASEQASTGPPSGSSPR